MKIEVFEGKEEQEVLSSALESLNKTKEEVVYYVTKTKGGLLKRKL